ncbi:MAG: elongation factor Ts [Gammaproteobacteria bacterium]|nr:MAG: elongation factor Ts [Gammaproteobacteria bacterium]
MAITASMVKELRERTSAGMMECKKALVESNGDMEAAADILRKAGAAKADKKAGRVAAEGLITVEQGDNAVVILEVNCETDFAAKNEDFQAFAKAVAERILKDRPSDLGALNQLPLIDGGANIEESLKELIGKVGENMSLRRFTLIESDKTTGSYMHKIGPTARIGVIVELEGGDEALARDIAMHVAGFQPPPQYINADEVPADVLEKEKAILTEQAADSGKPADIIEKMVQGRINKFLKEITLLGQPFVKDPDVTIEKLLKSNGASVLTFVRYELGEGIEKKQENFAEEVMAQARGA